MRELCKITLWLSLGGLAVSQFHAPEATQMEAEYKPIEPSFAPDLAEIEASEPEKLPPHKPEKSILHPPAARAADPPKDDSLQSAPVPPLETVQPITPALAESPVVEPIVYYWNEDLNAANMAAQERGVPIFLFFTQPDCIPCGLVKQFALKDATVRKFLEENYALAWVDVSKETEIAREFGVKTTPQVAIWNPSSPEFKLWPPESEPTHFLTDLRRMREQYDKELLQ